MIFPRDVDISDEVEIYSDDLSSTELFRQELDSWLEDEMAKISRFLQNNYLSCNNNVMQRDK